MHRRGKVYIIGAGCGNIDLLTIKAKRCIEEADCIVYDRLIDMKILDFAKKDAEKIYLGKENTAGGVIQDEINKTLVEKALEGKIVARVKGGDPFVFGRGGEEIEEIVKKSISFEVIPGISSSIAVPEYAGIPVTHRGIARSFHVFTGHTMENGEWHDFEIIAKLEGTLVFLMGIKNLGIIASDLIKNGKDPNTPVALIQKGTTPNQRVTIGKLEKIEKIAKKEGVVPPAIIIVGDVVNLRDSFEWLEKLPFFKKKIMVTRAKSQSEELIEKLLIKGAEVIEQPFLEIEKNEIDLERIGEYKAILFNSPNGVRFFLDQIKDIRILRDLKIGAVGKKTKELLEKNRLIPDFVPEKYLGEKLAEEVTKYTAEGDKVLFITSDISPYDCEKWSKKYERKYEKIVAYKTKKKIYKKEEVVKNIEKTEYITFFSSSTVEAFNESIEEDLTLLKDKKIVSIGPVTTKTLKKMGYNVTIEAEIFDVDGVIDAIGDEKNV